MFLYFHPGQEHTKLAIILPPILCLMDRLQIALTYPEKDGSFSEPGSICLDKTSKAYHSLVTGDPCKLQRISHLINFFVSGIRLAFSSNAGQTLVQQERHGYCNHMSIFHIYENSKFPPIYVN